jgi:CheY-like chemotaxis protein
MRTPTLPHGVRRIDGVRVLLVEDNALNQIVATSMLEIRRRHHRSGGQRQSRAGAPAHGGTATTWC